MQQIRLSPLALVILALLDERPMYPYRMQQVIRDRGTDEVVNVRHRASLHQTIRRLERDGLIVVQCTEQAGNRPERTLYELTGEGREALHGWLREMLGERASEFPAFPAALSFMYLLEPEVAREELTRRALALEAEERRLTDVLEEHADSVPRLFLVEVEYLRVVVAAEVTWVRGVIDELESGRLTWSREWIGQTGEETEETEESG